LNERAVYNTLAAEETWRMLVLWDRTLKG